MKATTYTERVRQLETEGLTTSDAQGVADMEVIWCHNNGKAVKENLWAITLASFAKAKA